MPRAFTPTPTPPGPLASRPTAGRYVGDLYVPTDAPLHYRWTGSAWQAMLPGYGDVTPPIFDGWINQGSSTEDTSLDVAGLTFARVASGGSMRARVANARTALPWTAELVLDGTVADNAAVLFFGVRSTSPDRNSNLSLFSGFSAASEPPMWSSERRAGAAFSAAGPISPAARRTAILTGGPLRVQIAVDATDITWSVAQGRGPLEQIMQEARTTWVATPDSIVVGAEAVTAAPRPVTCTVYSLAWS